MERDDRVTYIYLNLIDNKNRSAIYKIIEDMGITSTSTSQRTAAKIDKWSKSEKDLFIATYTPSEKDKMALNKVLGLKDESETINEVAAKNEELQKELHTSKKVIENLQNELCQQAEECRNTILELCKERDEKAEEIRLLNLELQKQEEQHTDTWSLMNDFHNELEEISKTKTQEKEVASEFREIIEEMIQLYISKNKDYGNAFSQSYNEFGAVMAVIRINDKLNRFKTLIKQDSEVKTESVKDTLIDLANYAVMTIIEMDKGKNK